MKQSFTTVSDHMIWFRFLYYLFYLVKQQNAADDTSFYFSSPYGGCVWTRSEKNIVLV